MKAQPEQGQQRGRREGASVREQGREVRAWRPASDEAGIHGIIAGSGVSLRLWNRVPPGRSWMPGRSSREKVGYVLAGTAELISERTVLRLEPGMTWRIPAGVTHTYRILSLFSAVEALARGSATSCGAGPGRPPARERGR